MTIFGLKQKKNLKENVACDLCISSFIWELLLSRCEAGSVVLTSQDIANHGRLIFAWYFSTHQRKGLQKRNRIATEPELNPSQAPDMSIWKF